MDWWQLFPDHSKTHKKASTHGISYTQLSGASKTAQKGLLGGSRRSQYPIRATQFLPPPPPPLPNNHQSTAPCKNDDTDMYKQQMTSVQVDPEIPFLELPEHVERLDSDVENNLPSSVLSIDNHQPRFQTHPDHHRKGVRTLSMSEDAILADIEQQQGPTRALFDDRSRKYSTSSTPRPTTDTNNGVDGRPAMIRRHSKDSVDNVRAFQEYKRSTIRKLLHLLDQMLPKLQHRCNIYFAAFFILSLSAITDHFQHTKSWFILYFVCIVIDIGTAIVDNLVFMYIDHLFSRHFEVAYMLHGFNGPLGLLGGIYLVHYFTSSFDATKTIPYWHKLLRASAIITVCMCVKNWYTRKHYIRLIEKRFAEKVNKLETWTIMLSELASMKPPKKVQPPAFLSRMNTMQLKMPGMFQDINKIQQKVIDVFADLVEATNHLNDENEEDIDMVGMLREVTAAKANSLNKQDDENPVPTTGSGSSGGDDTTAIKNNIAFQSTEEKPTIINDDSLKYETQSTKIRIFLRKRRTFWKLAARISANFGALKVFTYNGPVFIHRKFQAKQFGEHLYTHLSRGGKIMVTHEVLEKIFLEHNSKPRSSSNAADEELMMRIQEYSSRNSMKHGDEHKSDAMLLYDEALKVLDPFNLGYITPEQCMAAMIEIYKEQRFVANSLNDYGELHQSLRTVIDFVFWLIMALVIQAFLELNVFNYVIPFVTILLSISFALSPLLGNLFLSITFVFFMVPYDIGNKVIIGQDPSLRVVGYIRSVSLLHTTLNTVKNEIMKIPNHLLFHEYICNLSQSGGCVFEIIITFNMDESANNAQSKIDDYFERIKQYVLVECKAEWQSCSVYGVTLTPQDNIMTYSIWVTHRDNWQDITKPYNARTELIKYMKVLMAEMGLKFVKIQQPVQMLGPHGAIPEPIPLEVPSNKAENELRKRNVAQKSSSEDFH